MFIIISKKKICVFLFKFNRLWHRYLHCCQFHTKYIQFAFIKYYITRNAQKKFTGTNTDHCSFKKCFTICYISARVCVFILHLTPSTTHFNVSFGVSIWLALHYHRKRERSVRGRVWWSNIKQSRNYLGQKNLSWPSNRSRLARSMYNTSKNTHIPDTSQYHLACKTIQTPVSLQHEMNFRVKKNVACLYDECSQYRHNL